MLAAFFSSVWRIRIGKRSQTVLRFTKKVPTAQLTSQGGNAAETVTCPYILVTWHEAILAQTSSTAAVRPHGSKVEGALGVHPETEGAQAARRVAAGIDFK